MIPVIGQLLRCKTCRNPQFGSPVGKLHTSFHYANHCALLEVQRNFLTHDLRITAKPPQPQAMTEDRNMRRARKIIVSTEVAAERRSYTQHRKQIRCNPLSNEVF